MIRIIPYEDRFQPDFKRLNMEWLEKYNLLESHDVHVLDDPRGTVIDSGGYLFLAMDEGKVVGTAGMLKESEGVYELVKMSVDPEYRGQGISKLLLDCCLQEAKNKDARKIFLYSNSQLHTALLLYEKYGFQRIPFTDGPFVTADVKMEMYYPK